MERRSVWRVINTLVPFVAIVWIAFWLYQLGSTTMLTIGILWGGILGVETGLNEARESAKQRDMKPSRTTQWIGWSAFLVLAFSPCLAAFIFDAGATTVLAMAAVLIFSFALLFRLSQVLRLSVLPPVK